MMDRLEEYIAFMTEVFQRNLRLSELNRIKEWLKQDVSLSEITRAYGTMMKKCDKASFAYMAKIIENWQVQK